MSSEEEDRKECGQNEGDAHMVSGLRLRPVHGGVEDVESLEDSTLASEHQTRMRTQNFGSCSGSSFPPLLAKPIIQARSHVSEKYMQYAVHVTTQLSCSKCAVPS